MIWVIASMVAGLVARTLVPYLQTIKENPNVKFDRAFLLPPLMSMLISLAVAPFVFMALPADKVMNVSPTFLDCMLLFTLAWGATDVMRETQKFFGGKSQ